MLGAGRLGSIPGLPGDDRRMGGFPPLSIGSGRFAQRRCITQHVQQIILDLECQADGQTLRLTSRNPHNRLASEYRAYAKREYALTSRIADSEIVQ